MGREQGVCVWGGGEGGAGTGSIRVIVRTVHIVGGDWGRIIALVVVVVVK